jgi:hypothetical protein
MHEHKDFFGKSIQVGSYAVSYDHQTLDMFMVEKLNPKMVTVRKSNGRHSVRRYPRDLVMVENTEAIFKILSK